MRVLYNEIEPFAASWLRNLSAAREISPGDVADRSIFDLSPDEVSSYDRFHTFAGIGVWDEALRLAGWPVSVPVWTGSCPCQPFSNAGKRKGEEDERHLWPEWRRLIDACRPPVVFGEQVASKDGRAWLSAVLADLEAMGYRAGAADLSAAGVGAPHIRQRLFFFGYLPGAGGLVNASRQGLPVREQQIVCGAWGRQEGRATQQSGRSPGSNCDLDFWRDAVYLPCRDGKYRPTQPGLFPLAHGAPSRVGRLRAYGNAIVAQTAAVFIESVMDTIEHFEGV